MAKPPDTRTEADIERSVDKLMALLDRNGWRPARPDEPGGQWVQITDPKGEVIKIRCLPKAEA